MGNLESEQVRPLGHPVGLSVPTAIANPDTLEQVIGVLKERSQGTSERQLPIPSSFIGLVSEAFKCLDATKLDELIEALIKSSSNCVEVVLAASKNDTDEVCNLVASLIKQHPSALIRMQAMEQVRGVNQKNIIDALILVALPIRNIGSEIQSPRVQGYEHEHWKALDILAATIDKSKFETSNNVSITAIPNLQTYVVQELQLGELKYSMAGYRYLESSVTHERFEDFYLRYS